VEVNVVPSSLEEYVEPEKRKKFMTPAELQAEVAALRLRHQLRQSTQDSSRGEGPLSTNGSDEQSYGGPTQGGSDEVSMNPSSWY
jgi:hypothetical protein